ncbi:hypothetical protein VCHA36P166_30279 [Vibrio chagasii]|nr:hypothetical protein VCHA36P166_30279 [Vibrio chagasii]
MQSFLLPYYFQQCTKRAKQGNRLKTTINALPQAENESIKHNQKSQFNS